MHGFGYACGYVPRLPDGWISVASHRSLASSPVLSSLRLCAAVPSSCRSPSNQVLEFEWCLPTLGDMELDAADAAGPTTAGTGPTGPSTSTGTGGATAGVAGFGDISSLRLPPTLKPGQRFGDHFTVGAMVWGACPLSGAGAEELVH